MSKMKKVIKHTHILKYSTKEEYLEDDAGVTVLKADFSIYPEKKRITCVVSDDRFHLMVSGFIFPGFIDGEDEIIQRPTYCNSKKIYNYVQQFVNLKGDIVFTGIAKCHPEDTFDIQAGKQLALAKALDKRARAISHIQTLVNEGIAISLVSIAEQMIYNVNPDPTRNPNIKKKEPKQLKEA